MAARLVPGRNPVFQPAVRLSSRRGCLCSPVTGLPAGDCGRPGAGVQQGPLPHDEGHLRAGRPTAQARPPNVTIPTSAKPEADRIQALLTFVAPTFCLSWGLAWTSACVGPPALSEAVYTLCGF